jgi:hypothetical protein
VYSKIDASAEDALSCLGVDFGKSLEIFEASSVRYQVISEEARPIRDSGDKHQSRATNMENCLYSKRKILQLDVFFGIHLH